MKLPRQGELTKHITLRIPVANYNRLKKLAEAHDLGVTYFINRLVKVGLPKLEKKSAERLAAQR